MLHFEAPTNTCKVLQVQSCYEHDLVDLFVYILSIYICFAEKGPSKNTVQQNLMVHHVPTVKGHIVAQIHVPSG